MSRSGYSDDGDDPWASIRWRGAVASAIRGARGQAFLREMLTAMDALPEHKLIANELITKDGEVCAIGSVGKSRGMPMGHLDPEYSEQIAAAFGISAALAREIMFMNDDCFENRTPEMRFYSMRRWIEGNLRTKEPSA
jgi:hypothetical protein